MDGFLGNYLHQIDAKGRLSLPASFRRGHEDQSFVLTQRKNEALLLFPDKEWRGLHARLRDMSRRPEHRKQVLRAAAKAVPVAPDKQGRILIPDWMREAIGLTSEARVVGVLDHIEIWEPESFSKIMLEDDDDSEDLLTSILI